MGRVVQAHFSQAALRDSDGRTFTRRLERKQVTILCQLLQKSKGKTGLGTSLVAAEPRAVEGTRRLHQDLFEVQCSSL